MSKAVAAAAVGVGGTSIAVGGVYLSKMFNVDYVIPSELDKFTESNGGGCVQSIFPGIAKMQQSQNTLDAVGSSNDVALNGDANNTDVNGCLVVNWDKGKGQDKGRGNFRFLGALAKGNKGFIVYATADTSNTTTDKKLKVKGVRYLLEKEQGKTEWTIKKGKKVDAAGKDLEGSKLAKPGSKLQGMDANNPKWKFVDEDVNLDKLCTKEECKGDSSTDSFRGYWIFEKGGDQNEAADKGTSNISDWGKVVYEEDTNWNMSTVLANVKGEWKKKTLYGSPESTQKPETK